MAEGQNVRISKEVHTKAKQACLAHGLKLSALVERAIEKEVSRLDVTGKTTSRK